MPTPPPGRSVPAQHVLAELIAGLQALREATAASCELHVRERTILEHDHSADLIRRIQELLRRQNRELEQPRAALLAAPGLPPPPPAGGGPVMVAEFLQRVRKTERAAILRDLSTLLNLAASECTILHGAALATKDAELARLALAQLAEIAPVVIEISHRLPAAAVADLAARSPVADPLAADAAREGVQKAWSLSP